VRFGQREIDVTLAARGAIELGRESEALWDEDVERLKREHQSPDTPPIARCGHERSLIDALGQKPGRGHIRSVRELSERMSAALDCDSLSGAPASVAPIVAP
jgi:hypothetical protein